MPRRWLPVAAVTAPMASGAAKALILPEKEKKPKNSVVLSGGASLASSVRLDDWIGPARKPDKNGEGEIDLLAHRGEGRAVWELGLDGKPEQHMVAVDRQHANRRQHEEQQRPDDHALGAHAVVEHAAESGANRAGDGEDDAEQAKLGRAPAEHRRGIDAAKGEDGAEPVGIEHARHEEERDLGVMANEVVDTASKLLEPGSDRRGIARRGAGRSGVNRNSGRTKIRYQSAEKGPISRSPSRVAGSSGMRGWSPSSVLPVLASGMSRAKTRNRATSPPT